MNLFGRKKPATVNKPAPMPVDAIKELRSQLEILEKRDSFMQQRILQATQEAIKKKNGNDTKGALFELKRKKMFEAEAAKLQGARITLDSQIMALESASINMETVRAMKKGADTMKTIHGDMDEDAVDDLLQSIQEQQDVHNAISEAISRPGQDMFDDEDLLNELAELDALDKESSQNVSRVPDAVSTMPHLPSAPIKPVQMSHETDEERELRELEASMQLA